MLLLGDALEQLHTLADESAYTCVTSPSYYNLRDYEVTGQIGAENTPEEYIDKLVAVFREVRRVLRPDGTLWVNIGDSYAGSGKGRYPYPPRRIFFFWPVGPGGAGTGRAGECQYRVGAAGRVLYPLAEQASICGSAEFSGWERDLPGIPDGHNV